MGRYVLRLLSTLRKPFDVSRRATLLVTPRSISLGGHDPRTLNLVQGHPKNTRKLKLRFFWGRVYSDFSALYVSRVGLWHHNRGLFIEKFGSFCSNKK